MRNQSGAPEVREFLTVLRRWSDFAGRSSRREYWIYELVIVLISVLMCMLDGTILGEAALSHVDQRYHEFILERSDDALDLMVDLQFQHDLCAADIDAHRRARGDRTQYSPKQTPTKYNGPAASSTTAARSP